MIYPFASKLDTTRRTNNPSIIQPPTKKKSCVEDDSSSKNENTKRNNSRSLILSVLLTSLILHWSFSFENLADLHFFANISLPFEIYHFVFPPKSIYHVAQCHELGTIDLDSAIQPILFKGCMENAKQIGIDNFVTFPESITNAYPSCGSMTLYRHLNFTDFDGTVHPITERVICRSATLQSKVDYFKNHDSSKGDEEYFDVHVLNMNSQQCFELEQDWKKQKFVPPNFKVDRLGRTTGLVHFFNGGKSTAVNYFHSHMDHFLSFGVGRTKDWELIHPYYHNCFEYTWSGNAIVPARELSENKTAPRVHIRQEAGDILFVPSWWMHKAIFDGAVVTNQQTPKSASFNLHIMSTRSAVGIVSWLFARVLDVPDWFYDSAKTREIIFLGEEKKE